MNASEVRTFVKFAGPVPAPLQDYTNYEAAVTAKAAAPEAALALAQFISSQAAAQLGNKNGLFPSVAFAA